MKVLVLHGVNFNMFGYRDPKVYGTITLDEINAEISALAAELDVEVESFQSNHEGDIVERIHKGYFDKVDAVIINAGAWTHYSYAIRAALMILEVPVVELHMANIHARDEFRRHSCFVDCIAGQIAGFGVDSYLLALRAAVKLARQGRNREGK